MALRIIGFLALVAALTVLFAYMAQRRLMYFPSTQRIPPAAAGLAGVQEVVITVPSGDRIVAWYGLARPGRPTLLYFHGNGGGLVDRAPRIERYMAEGWGVFMMAYRGYAGSTGAPTEAANVSDAFSAYDWLKMHGVPAERLILYGESLGTGVATQIAAQRPAAGLVLDAPFTSAVEVGQLRFPFLPVALAMWDRYESRRHIGQVRMPVLVLHGTRDQVIPVEMGREMAKLANEPKTYVEFPLGGHSDLYLGGNDAQKHLAAFVRRVAP